LAPIGLKFGSIYAEGTKMIEAHAIFVASWATSLGIVLQNDIAQPFFSTIARNTTQ
ncbi:10635_t:CDS:1, partial [Gigaspora rosea]